MEDIPKEVLIDCAHLVKANSIQGTAAPGTSLGAGWEAFVLLLRAAGRLFWIEWSPSSCSAVLCQARAALTGGRCRVQLPGLPVYASRRRGSKPLPLLFMPPRCSRRQRPHSRLSPSALGPPFRSARSSGGDGGSIWSSLALPAALLLPQPAVVWPPSLSPGRCKDLSFSFFPCLVSDGRDGNNRRRLRSPGGL